MNAWLDSIGLLEFNELSMVVRLLLSVFCGFVLGLERTRKRRPAGLRTYMLVCIGSTVVMLTSQFLSQYYPNQEVTRMAAQVITGIGFLGAGTIMVTRYYRVKGLTTAAGLWCSACLGIAVGAGFYLGSIIVCVLVIFVMTFADKFENSYTRRLRRLNMYIIMEDVVMLKNFLHAMKEKGIGVSDVETAKADGGHGIGLFCQLKFPLQLTEVDTLRIVDESEGVLFCEQIDD